MRTGGSINGQHFQHLGISCLDVSSTQSAIPKNKQKRVNQD